MCVFMHVCTYVCVMFVCIMTLNIVPNGASWKAPWILRFINLGVINFSRYEAVSSALANSAPMDMIYHMKLFINF